MAADREHRLPTGKRRGPAGRFALSASLCLLAGAMLLISTRGHALGLGDISVRSYLGQPLLVRIELISRTPGELEQVSAALAKADGFRMVGIERMALSVPLQFTVNAQASPPHIEVRSQAPVSDPVVQFVLEVSFANGRMLREYTVFLDPPSFAAPVPMPAVTPRADNERARARKDAGASAEVAAAAREASESGQADAEPAPSAEPARAKEPAGQPGDMWESQAAPRVAAAEPEAAAGARDEVVDRPAAEPLEPAEGFEPDDLPAEGRTGPGTDSEAADPVSELENEPASAGDPVAGTAVDQPRAERVGAETDDADESQGQTGQVNSGDAPSAPGPEVAAARPDADAPLDALEADAAEQPATAMQGRQAPEPPAAQPALPDPAPESRQAPERRPTMYQVRMEDFETHGPVQRGETLWGIASGLAAGSGYSVNQAMLAIQRYNPEAFGRGNINLLRQGAILRLPPLDEMALLSAREAMLEAMRQADEYQGIRSGRPTAPAAPVMAASPPTETPAGAGTAMGEAEPPGRLELVPPPDTADSRARGTGAGGDGEGLADTGPATGEDGRLSEEELASAEAESDYLAERLEELEAEIGSDSRGIGLQDRGLAELEERLRAERNSGEQPDAMAVTPRAPDEAEPVRMGWWLLLLALLTLVAITALWLHRRAGRLDRQPQLEAAVERGDALGAVKAISDEAEEILAVLENAPDTSANTRAPAEDGDQNGEEAVPPGEDDIETRLDLARAYLAMDDPEAARQLLEEIVREGNEAQVAEAKRMLGEI